MIDLNDNHTQALPAVTPAWRALLEQAIATEGRGGVTKAAAAMGVSRVYVARVLMSGDNRIKAPSGKFIGRVLDAFGLVECPYLQERIKPGQCQDFAAREWKVIHGSGPEKVLHWRACQNCPKNPRHPSAAPVPALQTTVQTAATEESCA